MEPEKVRKFNKKEDIRVGVIKYLLTIIIKFESKWIIFDSYSSDKIKRRERILEKFLGSPFQNSRQSTIEMIFPIHASRTFVRR